MGVAAHRRAAPGDPRRRLRSYVVDLQQELSGRPQPRLTLTATIARLRSAWRPRPLTARMGGSSPAVTNLAGCPRISPLPYRAAAPIRATGAKPLARTRSGRSFPRFAENRLRSPALIAGAKQRRTEG